MTIFLPKKIVELEPTKSSPLFFLAGPIRGGGDWQAYVAESIIEVNSNALIACPSRWTKEHRLAKYFHKPFSQAENRQLVWERHYLKQAGLQNAVPGCVVFCLPPESHVSPHPGPEPYAMDTRREIGKFTAYAELLPDVRMVISGSPGFHGLDVIMYELAQAFGRKLEFHLNMRSLIDAAYATALSV